MTVVRAKPFAPDWPEPEARYLRPERPEPPELPLDTLLDRCWAAWVRQAAAAKGAPPDYVVAALLATAGATLGNARWPSPWAGWSEPPVLWCMVIGTPSAGKSPGLDAVLGPLHAMGRELARAAEAELGNWRERAELAKLVEATWKEQVRAALKAGETPPPKPEAADPGLEPAVPRLVVSDATVERMGVILAEQPRGLLMARDELSGWLRNMERYSGGSDREFWIEAYGGRTYSVERMTRDPTRVDRLTIGMLGGIQPDKLRTLVRHSDDDGLAARILPFWPHPAPISRPGGAPDGELLTGALVRLRGLDMHRDDPMDERRPFLVSFTEEVADRLDAFRRSLRDREAEAEGLLLSFRGKLPGWRCGSRACWLISTGSLAPRARPRPPPSPPSIWTAPRSSSTATPCPWRRGPTARARGRPRTALPDAWWR